MSNQWVSSVVFAMWSAVIWGELSGCFPELHGTWQKDIWSLLYAGATRNTEEQKALQVCFAIK